MTAVRYFGLLGTIAALVAVAYAFVVQFSSAPLAVSKQVPIVIQKRAVDGRTIKYQERWNGCYYDTRQSAVYCTEN